jgi:hypothetical protein
MGCNAWNHDPDCRCDFRGGHGFGGGGYGRRRFRVVAIEPALRGWSHDHCQDTVASYVNPNARCPECRAPVIFYQSPYNGRVFFDPPLGPPWPKHWCTDSRRRLDESPARLTARVPLPLQASRASVTSDRYNTEPSPLQQGWEPLRSARIYVREGHTLLTGDVGSRFFELATFDSGSFDHAGPILTRAYEDAPGFFEIAVLQSDPWSTKPGKFVAFERELSGLGVDVLSRVLKNDATALAEVGRIMLYEAGDLTGAVVYLRRAKVGGAPDIAIDLAVAALFPATSKMPANGSTSRAL